MNRSNSTPALAPASTPGGAADKDPARSGRGTPPNTSASTLQPTTIVPSTKRSSTDPLPNGGPTQPLVPVVVLPETLSDLPCSSETLISLSAICGGLLAETLSGDAMYLALMRAQDDALAAGVDPEEYQRVQDVILKHWAAKRSRNPLSKMYD